MSWNSPGRHCPVVVVRRISHGRGRRDRWLSRLPTAVLTYLLGRGSWCDRNDSIIREFRSADHYAGGKIRMSERERQNGSATIVCCIMIFLMKLNPFPQARNLSLGLSSKLAVKKFFIGFERQNLLRSCNLSMGY